MPLGIGKSVVIDLPRDIKDVLVADPKIANAVVRSSRRAYIIGVAVGQTNIYFFDADGQQIAGFDIAVTRDLNGMRAALKQSCRTPTSRRGRRRRRHADRHRSRARPKSQQAFDIAARLVGDGDKVVNGITVRGRDQVMLKVTVAEVQRDVIKQLGIDLNGSLGYGSAVLNFNNTNPFPAVGQPLVDANAHHRQLDSGVSATLRAMERAGVIRTLAEPNLTAISGESANFLAGGEFPVPAGYTCDPHDPRTASSQIQFKKFGVGLNFTPVVLSEGRISLKVMTEVSELSTENALTLRARATQHADHSVDQDPPRRDHGRNSLRRLARDGRHDPGADQAADQRHARPDAAAGARHAVQEPRLRQPPDRADGHRHALHRARGRAEGPVAAGRRLRRRRPIPAAILLGRFNRIYGVAGKRRSAPAATTASTASFSIERDAGDDDDNVAHDQRLAAASRRAPARSLASPRPLLAGCKTTAQSDDHRQRPERLPPAPPDRGHGRQADARPCSSAPAAAG